MNNLINNLESKRTNSREAYMLKHRARGPQVKIIIHIVLLLLVSMPLHNLIPLLRTRFMVRLWAMEPNLRPTTR